MPRQEGAEVGDSEKLFAELVAQMGAPALGPEEVAAVLRLAKAVADRSERRFAPVSCYAAGLVIGTATADPHVRLERLRAIIELVQRAVLA